MFGFSLSSKLHSPAISSDAWKALCGNVIGSQDPCLLISNLRPKEPPAHWGVSTWVGTSLLHLGTCSHLKGLRPGSHHSALGCNTWICGGHKLSDHSIESLPLLKSMTSSHAEHICPSPSPRISTPSASRGQYLLKQCLSRIR